MNRVTGLRTGDDGSLHHCALNREARKQEMGPQPDPSQPSRAGSLATCSGDKTARNALTRGSGQQDCCRKNDEEPKAGLMIGGSLLGWALVLTMGRWNDGQLTMPGMPQKQGTHRVPMQRPPASKSIRSRGARHHHSVS